MDRSHDLDIDFESVMVWLMLLAFGGLSLGAGRLAHLLTQGHAPWHQVGQLFDLLGFLGGVVVYFAGFWMVVVMVLVAHAQTFREIKGITRFNSDVRVKKPKRSCNEERKLLSLDTWLFPLLVMTAVLLIATDYFLYTGIWASNWHFNVAKCVAAWVCATTAFSTLSLATPSKWS